VRIRRAQDGITSAGNDHHLPRIIAATCGNDRQAPRGTATCQHGDVTNSWRSFLCSKTPTRNPAGAADATARLVAVGTHDP
jgi:hypothetical protein